MSDDEEVEVTFPFLVYIKMENSSLKEMMELCDGFDIWEVVQAGGDPKDHSNGGVEIIEEKVRNMIVDVIEVANDEIVIKITLRQSLTYMEIYQRLVSLIDFVKKRTERECFMHIERVLWEKPIFGVPSELKKKINLNILDQFRV